MIDNVIKEFNKNYSIDENKRNNISKNSFEKAKEEQNIKDEQLKQILTLKNNIQLELPGKYCFHNGGIYKPGSNDSLICIIPHMLFISCIYRNIEKKEELVEITSYRRGKKESHIIEKEVIAKKNKITILSKYGCSITDINSKEVVDYLQEFELYNENKIPIKDSVSHLGWTTDYNGFIPYTNKELIIDNKEEFESIFKAIKSKGSLQKSIVLIRFLREQNVINKIILTTSFASVLIKPLDLQNFVFHIWGGTGTGKSLLYSVACSIWGNPREYLQNMNSTLVALTRVETFINNLPLILDELQLINNKNTYDDIIYTLSEGKEKLKGTINGTLNQNGGTWSNLIMVNGEKPILSENSQGGAKNRTILIECEEQLYKNSKEISDIFKSNYGLIGKDFIKKILCKHKGFNIKNIKEFYNNLLSDLLEKYPVYSEKQLNAIALILVTDNILCKFYGFNNCLTFNDIEKYVFSNDSVSNEKKAYEYLLNEISANYCMFEESNTNRTWGVIDSENGNIYINKNDYISIMDRGGFDSDTLLSYLKKHKLIKTSPNRKWLRKRINNVSIDTLNLKYTFEERK